MVKNILMIPFDSHKYGLKKDLLDILTYGTPKNNVGIDTLIKSAIGIVQSMIQVDISKSTYELQVSAFEPKLAADIASAIIDELDKHQREYNAR